MEVELPGLHLDKHFKLRGGIKHTQQKIRDKTKHALRKFIAVTNQTCLNGLVLIQYHCPAQVIQSSYFCKKQRKILLSNSKEKSRNIYFIQLRRTLITNHTHIDGQCLREIKFKPR